MRSTTALAGLLGTCAFALASAGCAGDDAAPAKAKDSAQADDGMIAFLRAGEVGEYDIWVVRPSGAGLRRVTKSPAGQADFDPEWRPRDSTLLFSRRLLEESGDDGDDLFLVGADGKGLRRVTHCSGSCYSDGEAAWSPNGRRITFVRATGNRELGPPSRVLVYVMKADGTRVRRLSRPSKAYEDHYPTWSPDGRTIVFQRDTRTDVPGRTRLFAVDVGSGKERLVHTQPKFAPGAGLANYAPRGSRFVFGYWCIFGDSCPPSSRRDRNATLLTIRDDGSGLRRLRLGVPADTGAWSPDGKRLLYRCQPKPFEFHVCHSRPDGSHRQVLPWEVQTADPDWGRP